MQRTAENDPMNSTVITSPSQAGPKSTDTNPAPPANAGEEADAAQSLASIQAHLAWLRTRMALETTLAGWVRTASALIAFGFAIVQFFENYKVTQVSNGNDLARYLGLVLIGIGSVATAIAVWEYRKVRNYLEGEAFQGIAGVPGMRRIYPAVVVAILLCLIGLLAFITILVGVELPWPAKP
jgi:putative membrane protein